MDIAIRLSLSPDDESAHEFDSPRSASEPTNELSKKSLIFRLTGKADIFNIKQNLLQTIADFFIKMKAEK
jgi:hypothetical protein